MEKRDTIPADVKRTLREEVGYGCPVCRKPFLTWHHFDPPYHVRRHNNPDGMIALCAEHHAEADTGAFSKAQLRAMKEAPHSVKDVKGSFPSWGNEKILVRFGGIYQGGEGACVSIAGRPIINVTRNEVGLLTLSFELCSAEGKLILKMVDNDLELYPKDVHDFVALPGKKGVSLWIKDRDIGVDLRFDRITLSKLSDILRADLDRSKKRIRAKVLKDKSLSEYMKKANLEEEQEIVTPEMAERMTQELPEELREVTREGYLTGDRTGAWIKKWVRENLDPSDQTIPLLNFKKVSYYFPGGHLSVRNGFAAKNLDLNYCFAAANALGTINLPATT